MTQTTAHTAQHTNGAAKIAALDYSPFDVPEPEPSHNGTGEHHDRRFVLIHGDQLAELPPARYLDASKEIPAHSLTLVYGQTSAGKSFWVLDRSLRVAQSRPVVYVAGEGADGYAARTLVWRKHFGKDLGDFWIVPRPPDMLNEQDLNAFIAAILPAKPELVVIDTLARSMAGDENSARDMGAFVAACDRVREHTGAAVVVVHHTGKAGTSERGSSSLKAACDQVIEIANSDGLIRVACRKSKDSAGFERYSMRLVVIESGRLLEDGANETSCVILPSSQVLTTGKLSDNQWAILEAIGMEIFSEAGARARQLSEITGLGSSSAYTALNSLKNSGHIRQDKKGDPFYITKDGSDLVYATRALEANGA